MLQPKKFTINRFDAGTLPDANRDEPKLDKIRPTYTECV